MPATGQSGLPELRQSPKVTGNNRLDYTNELITLLAIIVGYFFAKQALGKA